MSDDIMEQVKLLLKGCVEKSSTIPDLNWDRIGSMQLSFDPYAPTESEKTAHYFLLIMALDTSRLVGPSENARALLISIHSALGDDLFRLGQADNIRKIAQKFNDFCRLGELKEEIPEVIDSVNLFVQKKAHGNMVKYAKSFPEPKDMANEIGNSIRFVGVPPVDQAWMYLRWMVRPYPDLNLFKNFSCKQLQIPLTSFVRNVAFCLGLSRNHITDWSDSIGIERERKRLTEFAADLFPEDPTIVDYPLYVLGRWIRDEKLSLELLRSRLQFWKKVYDQLKKPPIMFSAVPRNESTFEREVRGELEKLQVMFLFEPYPFTLPEQKGAPHYRPDFVLPRVRKKGRIVILEPHGVWTPLQKRIVSLGTRSFPIWVKPTRIGDDELEFVNKLQVFREIYGGLYYLILIIPSAFKERVENDYPEIYDEVYDGLDIPKLLYDLKGNMD
jgi:hypothetical protein